MILFQLNAVSVPYARPNPAIVMVARLDEKVLDRDPIVGLGLSAASDLALDEVFKAG